MTTWREVAPDERGRIGAAGILRVALRLIPLAMLLLAGLAVLLAIRLVERPLCGLERPVSPKVTQAVSRMSLWLVGLGYRVEGCPMRHRGAVVANHSSWLDIFVLNACQSIYFVSKSEVSGWFFIGSLARATGTLFIARDPRAAKAQQALFEARLRAGHKLLFFPEGTSTDGLRVLPFKSTLFAAYYTHGLDHIMQIQPVTVIYRAPEGISDRIYGWWGDMNFGQHLLKILALSRQGSAEVVFHAPVSVDDFPSRKDLAQHCEKVVSARLRAALGESYAG